MKYIRHIQYMILVLIFSLPLFSFGQNKTGSAPKTTIDNPLSGNEDLFAFINTLIDAAIKLGAVIAVLAIIYAGFLFVTAQGDEEKIKTAKRVLLYSAIGIAILLGARVIADVIENTVKGVETSSGITNGSGSKSPKKN